MIALEKNVFLLRKELRTLSKNHMLWETIKNKSNMPLQQM